ncbi:hypothetical protein MAFF241647_18600 [Ralstonia solanacearum]|nr:hypothetical protein MAFF241647_18600 [Ralstonia solanacearum]
MTDRRIVFNRNAPSVDVPLLFHSTACGAAVNPARAAAPGAPLYQATGSQNDCFAATRKPGQGLPAIEPAQSRSGYASQRQAWIRLDFNFRTNRPVGAGHLPRKPDRAMARARAAWRSGVGDAGDWRALTEWSTTVPMPAGITALAGCGAAAPPALCPVAKRHRDIRLSQEQEVW